MNEIKEACGVGLVKLLKGVDYYPKNFLLDSTLSMCSKMEHRGRDGAGISVVAPDIDLGNEWMHTITAPGPTTNLAEEVKQYGIEKFKEGTGAICHRRYSTASDVNPVNIQPMERYHPRPTKRIAIAWNGNLTNNPEHIERIKKRGYRARTGSDTERMLNDFIDALKIEHDIMELEKLGPENIDLTKVITKASAEWDGAYTLAGILGNGDSFFINDPNGIRPACYAITEDKIVAASESAVLTNVFKTKPGQIKTLPRGHALIIKNNGHYEIKQYKEQGREAHCKFEYVYLQNPASFLWGEEVYKARYKLGKPPAIRIYQKIKHNEPKEIVVIPVPHTARPAAKGTHDTLEELFNTKIRYEEGLIKDPTTGRTFIASDEVRDSLVSGAFYTIYSVIKDMVVVVVEDSTVRGTTFEKDVISCIKEASPREIHAMMSCPPLLSPCPYGIDMARYSKYIAFKALVDFLKESDLEEKIQETYDKCKQELKSDNPVNPVIELYSSIPFEVIETKVAKRFGINSMTYQTIEGLEESIGLKGRLCNACLHGKYPTIGGIKVALQGFIDFIEGKDKRAYE